MVQSGIREHIVARKRSRAALVHIGEFIGDVLPDRIRLDVDGAGKPLLYPDAPVQCPGLVQRPVVG